MIASRLLSSAALLMLLGGCALSQNQTPREGATLYERLGGEPGVAAIVENLLYRVADDERIVGYFLNTNIDYLNGSLQRYICAKSDGPCRYDGPSMAKAHQHMRLADADFNALVEHLQGALIEEGVPTGARNRLLGRLAGDYAEVMRHQGPPSG